MNGFVTVYWPVGDRYVAIVWPTAIRLGPRATNFVTANLTLSTSPAPATVEAEPPAAGAAVAATNAITVVASSPRSENASCFPLALDSYESARGTLISPG